MGGDPCAGPPGALGRGSALVCRPAPPPGLLSWRSAHWSRRQVQRHSGRGAPDLTVIPGSTLPSPSTARRPKAPPENCDFPLPTFSTACSHRKRRCVPAPQRLSPFAAASFAYCQQIGLGSRTLDVARLKAPCGGSALFSSPALEPGGSAAPFHPWRFGSSVPWSWAPEELSA